MVLQESILKLESLLNSALDRSNANSISDLNTKEKKEFEMQLAALDLALGGDSFISYHIGDERELYNLRANHPVVDYDQHSRQPGRRDLIRKVDSFFAEQIKERVPRLGKVTKLDIACGTGERTNRYDGYVRRSGFLGLSVGLDSSDGMLEKVNRYNIKTVQSLMTNTHFRDGSFNLVTLLFNSMGHLDRKNFERTFRETYRIMKKGGIFLFDAYTDETSPADSGLYLGIQDLAKRKELEEKRLQVKKLLNQRYEVYFAKGTDKPQSNYVFTRRQILGLAKKAGFEVVSTGIIKASEVENNYVGAEMFVLKK